jgi:hypothetical protein
VPGLFSEAENKPGTFSYKCVEDYQSGRRASDALLTGMLPLQKNVHRILASADLV